MKFFSHVITNHFLTGMLGLALISGVLFGWLWQPFKCCNLQKDALGPRKVKRATGMYHMCNLDSDPGRFRGGGRRRGGKSGYETRTRPLHSLWTRNPLFRACNGIACLGASYQLTEGPCTCSCSFCAVAHGAPRPCMDTVKAPSGPKVSGTGLQSTPRGTSQSM